MEVNWGSGWAADQANVDMYQISDKCDTLGPMKKMMYQQVTIFALRFLLCGVAGLLFSIVNLVLEPFVFSQQAQLIDEVPVLLYLPMIPGVIAWHLVSEAIARKKLSVYLERGFVLVWSFTTAHWLITDYFPSMDMTYRTYVLVANMLLAWLAVEASFVLFRFIGARPN